MPRALTRCVGISCCAFCTACGQSRTLLRSSSGAEVAFRQPRPGLERDDVDAGLGDGQRGDAAGGAEADDDDLGVFKPGRHGRAILRCLSPRVASPSPPLVLALAGTRSGLGEHRVVVRRLVIRRERDADALFVLRDDRANAGIADQIPADEIRVAAVKRIAERALNGVGADKSEKPRRQAVGLAGLDVLQDRVLVGRSQSCERRAVRRDGVTIDRRETGGVRLTVRRKETGERAIDVMRGPRFRGARPVRIRRNQPGADGLEDVGFGRSERFERLASDRGGAGRLTRDSRWSGVSGRDRGRGNNGRRGSGEARLLQQFPPRERRAGFTHPMSHCPPGAALQRPHVRAVAPEERPAVSLAHAEVRLQPLHGLLLAPLDVVPHRRHRPRRGTRREREREIAVPSWRAHARRPRQQTKPRGRERAGLLDGVRQRHASGAFGDPAVQLVVQREVRRAVLPRRQLVDARGHLDELRAFALRGDPREQSGGFGLEDFANEIMTANVLRRRNPDTRAGSRTAFEQALELEAQQRLRDRQKAHAELGRDLASRDRLPERDFAAKNPAPHDAVRLGREARVSATCRQSSTPHRCFRFLCTSPSAGKGTADASDPRCPASSATRRSDQAPCPAPPTARAARPCRSRSAPRRRRNAPCRAP